MRNETIAKIITWLNTGDRGDRIFLRSLSDNVRQGFVWPRLPDGQPDKSYYTFFFIDNDSGTCIAAVLDMGEDDLHAYTRQRHRRKGIMARALQDVILPYLVSQGRLTQNITFQSEAGRHLAKAMGFRLHPTDTGASIDLCTLNKEFVVDRSPIPLGGQSTGCR